MSLAGIARKTAAASIVALTAVALEFSAISEDRPTPVGGEPPKIYVCRKATGPITIDGALDEEAWVLAAWTDAFVDIEGDAKPRPRFRTRAKMTWDDKHFYVAAELDEPHVWGTLTKHDSVIFQDNDFEIFIDPDGDNHEYYEIEINALNTEWDLFLKKPYRDGGPADNSWEIPGLKTAVKVQGTLNKPTDLDRSWTVEFAIPWKALAKDAHLPTPPREGDHWRVNFSRVEWRHLIEDGRYKKVPGTKEDNWVWSPQGVIDMHRPERWGYVRFTSSNNDEVRGRPDPEGPARDRLIEIYYAQRKFQAANKRWAASIDELGIDRDRRPPALIRKTDKGYEAMVVMPLGLRKIRAIYIDQESRIRLGPTEQAPGVSRN